MVDDDAVTVSGRAPRESPEARPLSPGIAIARAFVAAVVMALGLVVATEVSTAIFDADASAASGLGTRVAVAAGVSILVVGAIVLLRRCWDRRSLTGIGLTDPRSSVWGFGVGFLVLLGSGTLVLLLLDLTGVVGVRGVDPLELLAFVLGNMIVALLLEALPEELAIRGYALTNLREAFRPWLAVLVSLAAFLVVPVTALTAQWLLGIAAGTGTGFAWAPPGEDPAAYYIMLVAFGYLLVCARDATTSATIWTAIGAHLAWLTMNRVVLGARGLDLEIDELGLLLFFAGYATLSIFAFTWLRARSRRAALTS